MTRKQAIDFLTQTPYKFGHMLGFTKLTELHNGWIVEMLTGKEDKTLQASRGTYKTTCVSIALALQIILLPSMRSMFMRKTDADVKEVIKQVQKILRDPHTQVFVSAIYGVELKLLVQSTAEVSTNLSVDTKGTSQLVGVGTGASLTGKHFNRIFTDDIVNIKDRISKAEREQTKIVYQELQNIKNRGGKIFNTGTPWHVEDAFSIMPHPVRYNCYHPLVKEIILEEELAHIKESMTASLFAANYELKHVADDDVIFSDPQIGADPALVEQGTSHCDAAYYGEDYTAFTICATHEGKYYVFGKCWRKHIDDVMPEIAMWHEKFMCKKMYNEINADKGYVAQKFRGYGVKVVTYNEHQNKHIKIVSHLKFVWKDVIFVKGTDDEYIDQICEYNENAEHDDCPDSLSSLIRVLSGKMGREMGKENLESVFL